MVEARSHVGLSRVYLGMPVPIQNLGGLDDDLLKMGFPISSIHDGLLRMRVSKSGC